MRTASPMQTAGEKHGASADCSGGCASRLPPPSGPLGSFSAVWELEPLATNGSNSLQIWVHSGQISSAAIIIDFLISMLRTCRALPLLLAAMLCSEAVRAVSPAASHARLVLRPILRGGHIGSYCAPTHHFSSPKSDQTPGQLRRPVEGDADCETAEALPEVTGAAPPTHSSLLRFARGVTIGAVTPLFACCVPFLREEDDDGRRQLEVMARFLPAPLRSGRI